MYLARQIEISPYLSHIRYFVRTVSNYTSLSYHLYSLDILILDQSRYSDNFNSHLAGCDKFCERVTIAEELQKKDIRFRVGCKNHASVERTLGSTLNCEKDSDVV